MTGTIATEIREIEEHLSEIEEIPITTLEILGKAGTEGYWETFLLYFIDATNPHGFGTDVLEGVINAICSCPKTTLERPEGSLENVEVYSQVTTDTGPVDIVLWERDEWFICIELKIHSPESDAQTVRYADSTTLGEIPLGKAVEYGEYVYLAAGSAPDSQASEFIDIPWSHIVKHLEAVLFEGQGRYPAKSSAQLADYLDTIKRELDMGDLSQISEETKLYRDHKETIDRLQKSFERDKKLLYNNLETAMRQEFGETEKWCVSRTRSHSYLQFYRSEWRGIGPGVNIEYEPHVKLGSESPQLRLRLDIENSGKEELRTAVENRFDERRIEEMGWEVTDGSYDYIAKTVPVDFENPSKSIETAAQEFALLHNEIGADIKKVISEYKTQSSDDN